MRIFFLTYSYERGINPDLGGFRKLWELARALNECGHQTHVFYPSLPGFSALRDVPSHAYPVLDISLLRPVTAYISMLWAALVLARQARPDLIYFRSGLNVLPRWLGWLLKARVVLEVNADAAEFHANQGGGWWRGCLIRLIEGQNVRKSDLVIALTTGLKRMLVELYDVSERRITVIPSGTDPGHFAPADRRGAKSKLGLNPEEPVVGFIGIFYRHQGVHTLIQAASSILEEYPMTRFLLVGDGEMRMQWETLAKQNGVDTSIWFTGQIPYEQVPSYLQAMDILVAPFTVDRGETSPFKILDAWASGCPVVASDLPSVRVLEQESDAIALVPPDQNEALSRAVLALLRDPKRREIMGRAGRAHVCEHYSWERIAQQLLNISLT